MSAEDLQRLLNKAADDLTPDEEADLARLLADPAHRDIAEKDLAALRHRLGRMLAYQDATRANEPQPSEAARTRFEDIIASIRTERAGRAPRHGWGRLLGIATLAAAACVAFIVYRGGALAAQPEAVELAVISRGALTRGGEALVAPNRPSEWRVIELGSLAEQTRWAEGPLADDVRARVWIDEDRGVLRAVFRRGENGTIVRKETRLDPMADPQRQIREFIASLR